MKTPRVLIALCGLLLCGVADAAPKQAPVAGTIIQDCRDCPELVVVPPGQFKMGSLEGDPDRSKTPIRDVRIVYSFSHLT